ncbi:HEAT repeat domain-containing protein [Tundrisphaera lichenicola]|uniref:HEAT repeat domain-containing protein n=1 Tax=Tundrisphaera lichenicola TaxID=2029860 RepID=UPI003EB942E2
MVRSFVTLGIFFTGLAASSIAVGQSDPVVARGVQFLKGSGGSGGVGETALAALALVKAEVSPSDPSVTRALDAVMKRFEASAYQPEKGSGGEIYEAGVTILFLASLDAASYRNQIEGVARFLAGSQNPNGSWDYRDRSAGDTSISQYAILGLWEAENVGVPISPSIWDRAAQWFMSVQAGGGSWCYHRDQNSPETIAMTAAGVGSLLICDRQLAPYRTAIKVSNPLLVPVFPENERRKYQPQASSQRIAQSVRAGIGWLAANFATSNTQAMGQSPYYALYGIERIGALADQATFGRHDWFTEGRQYLASSQKASGGFSAQYGDGPNTSWAVLFLSKATAKTIRKIQVRRLGAGTLIGGRGLPKDLSQISVAGGRVVARPMDGAVEGMLSVLEDPRVEDASSALAGLVARYRTEGSSALKPFEDRFRKLLTDPDQGVRRVAAWSLARTGDLAMAPPLIEALRDPDEGVVAEAQSGLQLLARKLEGFGPAPPATPEQKEAAIERWKAWYESTKPLSPPAEDRSISDPTSTGRRAR